MWRLIRNKIILPAVLAAVVATLLGVVAAKRAANWLLALTGLDKLVYSKPPVVVSVDKAKFADKLAATGYNFKANYAMIHGVRVHYVDEGPRDAKETLLCVHGEPSWSYLYRLMVPVFVAAGYRVVCPDFIGFGLSDKWTDIDRYTHERHVDTLLQLVDKLNLQNVTMVVQDWGGLTGLSSVKHYPERIARLVIMNTGLPPHGSIWSTPLSQTLAFLSWRTFCVAFPALPVRGVFKFALKRASDDVLDCYALPYPNAASKAGAAKWPLLVPITENMHVAKDMKATRQFLRTQWKKPVLVMFSTRDPITRGLDKFFLKLFQNNPHLAKPITVHKAGHFLQEDAGEEIANNIVRFIVNSQ
eukprot:TRINITY_DN65833_c6_g2_i1.p2 TRINITY_DN65833_c6_g2~~TRINITY_DN65833_c6_g2_i1.p2  ORF type:complete len:358 (+),score=132.68 TRINITY_DN65833_c6_g2_i1:67-1140(+)